ncbi:MAG: arylsulfatase A-like enzyme [Planctomycetota bacterium]|jgi:arylsulfatase A-like enzyme
MNPRRSWLRSGSASIALALVACVASCGPRTIQVTETRALLPLLNRFPGAESGFIISQGDHTENMALLPFKQRLTFPNLQLPAGTSISFRVRTLTEGQIGPAHVVAIIDAVGLDGVATSSSEPIQLKGEPGQRWFPVQWNDDDGNGLSALTIAFGAPEKFDTASAPGLKVAVLRPTARFPRTLSVTEDDKEQILLITMDTLRADHLGCYGHEEKPSPRIDQLAAESVRFESCYSTTNVTNPSHASILTSLDLRDHEVRNNFTKLSADIPNLVTSLRQRDFKTAAFVSSHNFQPGLTGFDTLFEEFFPSELYLRRAEDVNAELLPWLSDHQGDDFFVWVHYYDAHGPYDATYPFNTQFKYRGRGPNPVLNSGMTKRLDMTGDRALASAQYLGEIAYLDLQFGEVLDHLGALEIYDTTKIILTSDHGESLGEHGRTVSHSGLHETTTHVPLIIRIPGKQTGVVSGLVSSLDIYPTLFDYLELPISGKIRGSSLRPLMDGLHKSERERVFAESAHGFQVMVRTPEYRAILGLEDTAQKHIRVTKDKLEMFATPNDLKEQNNITRFRPELAQKMRELLEAYASEGMALGAEAIVDKDFVEQMEGLGYVK